MGGRKVWWPLAESLCGAGGQCRPESWRETPLPERTVPLSVTLSPPDLPRPQLSERRDPDPTRMQMPPGNPLLLSHTLQELLARDTVQVELVPEKKGLFLKHVEYQVSSQVPVAGRRRVWLGRGSGPCGGRGPRLAGAQPPSLPVPAMLLLRRLVGKIPSGGGHPDLLFSLQTHS